jgi:hypothetical protein
LRPCRGFKTWTPCLAQSATLRRLAVSLRQFFVVSSAPTTLRLMHSRIMEEDSNTSQVTLPPTPSRGRCYDHNFLRFLAIFAEKIGVFLKKPML